MDSSGLFPPDLLYHLKSGRYVMIKRIRINKNETGLRFSHGELIEVLESGVFWRSVNRDKGELIIADKSNLYLKHENLDIIVKSGLLEKYAYIIDLKDNERAIIWKDGRFDSILSTGLYLIWKEPYNVEIEKTVTDPIRFEHKKEDLILSKVKSGDLLELLNVEEGYEALLFLNGTFSEKLVPGRYAFWKGVAKVKVYTKDLREKVLEIPGQDIITADNVSIRITAVVNFRIADSLKLVLNLDNPDTAIYREAQLILRSIIGTKDLDNILKEKNQLSKELEEGVSRKMEKFGIRINGLGIRDIILPGDMKDILNMVMVARKKAEANLIARREETASMRSQANTAKMLENNPALIRLKELEIVEKAVENGKFNFVLGENSLTKGVLNIL